MIEKAKIMSRIIPMRDITSISDIVIMCDIITNRRIEK